MVESGGGGSWPKTYYFKDSILSNTNVSVIFLYRETELTELVRDIRGAEIK